MEQEILRKNRFFNFLLSIYLNSDRFMKANWFALRTFCLANSLTFFDGIIIFLFYKHFLYVLIRHHRY